MKNTGIWIAALGVVIMVAAPFVPIALERYEVDGLPTANLDLLFQRQLLHSTGVALFLAGVILRSAAAITTTLRGEGLATHRQLDGQRSSPARRSPTANHKFKADLHHARQL